MSIDPWTFPTNVPAPAKIEFAANWGTRRQISPLTGRVQYLSFQSAQEWELNVSYPALVLSQAQSLSAFINGLNGQERLFYW